MKITRKLIIDVRGSKRRDNYDLKWNVFQGRPEVEAINYVLTDMKERHRKLTYKEIADAAELVKRVIINVRNEGGQ